MLAQPPVADGRPQGTSSAGAPHSTHPLPVAARVSPMAMPAMVICAFDRPLASSRCPSRPCVPHCAGVPTSVSWASSRPTSSAVARRSRGIRTDEIERRWAAVWPPSGRSGVRVNFTAAPYPSAVSKPPNACQEITHASAASLHATESARQPRLSGRALTNRSQSDARRSRQSRGAPSTIRRSPRASNTSVAWATGGVGSDASAESLARRSSRTRQRRPAPSV